MEDDARKSIEQVRSEDRFNPDKVGQYKALKHTRQFLEENEFHLHDTRLGLTTFLTEKFPCGARPSDFIKRLRVYIHCEDVVKRAGWVYDQEDEELELLDEDFPWQERQNLIYDDIFHEANRVASIPFANQPHLTLALVLKDDDDGDDYLDLQRIQWNFKEALLRAYHGLKPQCETITFVESPIFNLITAEPEDEHRHDDDITPHMEIANREFIQVCLLPGRSCALLTRNRGAMKADIRNIITQTKISQPILRAFGCP
jgi:hypothetical protein